jgi:hypothetical protein
VSPAFFFSQDVPKAKFCRLLSLGIARPATSPLSASSTLEHDFDQLLESYGSLFSTERKPLGVSIPLDIGLDAQQGGSSAAAGKKDEWEGLF